MKYAHWLYYPVFLIITAYCVPQLSWIGQATMIAYLLFVTFQFVRMTRRYTHD